MAVPLIIKVAPTSGITGGGAIVDIMTNNARLPPDPPASGYVGGSTPVTVQILFGDAVATHVQVISKGRVLCRAPANAPGVFGVTIKNLDDSGVPIVGEEFTKANAYTYARPSLTYDPATVSDLTRIVETLILNMRTEVIENVGLTTHTDFDEETGDYVNSTKQAKLPALTLVGPDMLENRFYSINSIRYSGAGATVIGHRNPYTVDLQFQVIGASESTRQLIELLFATIQYFHRNGTISMLCDPDDPSLGYLTYDMDFIQEGGEPEVTSRLGISNVRSFSGTVFIRGFDLEDFRGVTDDTVIAVTERVTDVSFCYDPPLAIDITASSIPKPDPLPEAPDIGDFDISIIEQES